MGDSGDLRFPCGSHMIHGVPPDLGKQGSPQSPGAQDTRQQLTAQLWYGTLVSSPAVGRDTGQLWDSSHWPAVGTLASCGDTGQLWDKTLSSCGDIGQLWFETLTSCGKPLPHSPVKLVFVHVTPSAHKYKFVNEDTRL